MLTETLRPASSTTHRIDTVRRELEHSAYHGRHAAVYTRYKNIPEQDRIAYQSVDILNSVLRGGFAQLNRLKAGWEPTITGIIDGVVSDIEHDLEQFIQYCSSRNIRPRQLYACILDWGNELASIAKAEEAFRLLERAENLNIRTYPDLYARLILKRAELLFDTGRLRDARQVLSGMAERYYLVTDRDVISGIFVLFGQTSLLIGEGRYFKNLLFKNLRYVFTSKYIRRLFTDLIIKKIYLHSYRVLLDSELSFSDRVLFMAHWWDYAVYSSWPDKMRGRDRLTGFFPRAIAYILNSFARQKQSPPLRILSGAAPRPAGADEREACHQAGRRKIILVTRAMGGIGDLLMMTPGLHSLKKKYPEHEIHLALPRQYKALFAGNADITLLDIEKDEIDVGTYAQWFNFTDIPEAFVESRTLPNVKKNRIEIFARSLGIGGSQLRRMEKRPRYVISAEEKSFQQKFWIDQKLEGRLVIGVQLKSAEPYRDYPYMAELIQKLAAESPVILFHSEQTSISAGGNIIDPGRRSLREAFALAAACDVIIAPDSAFVHFAGALNIPCIALYGPIDGRIRTMDYPSCTHLDARRVLQCVPCWRNEIIPCKLTGERNSACMGIITVDEIYTKLKKILREKT